MNDSNTGSGAMLRTPRVIATAVLIALLAVVTPIAPAGAQDTVERVMVHALNLDGQDDQNDAGTPITWCNDDERADPNWEFGQQTFWPLPGGTTVNIQLYLGADVDCADPGSALLLTDQTLTMPTAGAVLWVVASPPGADPYEDTEIVQYTLDASCLDPAVGRSTFVHAAATGPLDLEFDGEDIGTVSFGEQSGGDVPPGMYDLAISGGASWSGTVEASAGNYTADVAAGLFPVDPDTPFVLLRVHIEVEPCPAPLPTSTTTTAADHATSTAVPTTTAAAQPAALQPSLTG